MEADVLRDERDGDRGNEQYAKRRLFRLELFEKRFDPPRQPAGRFPEEDVEKEDASKERRYLDSRRRKVAEVNLATSPVCRYLQYYRQYDKRHDVVYHCSSHDGVAEPAVQYAKLHEHYSANRHRRYRQEQPHKERLHASKPKEERHVRASQKRHKERHDRNHYRRLAGAPYLPRVHLQAGEEHQKEHCEIREHLQVRTWHHEPEQRRAYYDPGQKLADKRRLLEPLEYFSKNARGDKDDDNADKQLLCRHFR